MRRSFRVVFKMHQIHEKCTGADAVAVVVVTYTLDVDTSLMILTGHRHARHVSAVV